MGSRRGGGHEGLGGGHDLHLCCYLEKVRCLGEADEENSRMQNQMEESTNENLIKTHQSCINSVCKLPHWGNLHDSFNHNWKVFKCFQLYAENSICENFGSRRAP